MIVFADVQFPPEISYGFKGGPIFSTNIVTTFSGHEQRNINWQMARSRYDIGSGIKTQAQWQELISFFRARRGRAIGFRYKDWSDYQSINQLLGKGDSQTKKFQLVKNYISGGYIYARIITKPVKNSFCKIYLDSCVVQTEEIDIDFTTGSIVFAQPPRRDEEITADFEFDVPVRFDTDHLDLSMDNFNIGSWGNIPLIEIRV